VRRLIRLGGKPAGSARGVLRLDVVVGLEQGVGAGGEFVLPAAEMVRVAVHGFAAVRTGPSISMG